MCIGTMYSNQAVEVQNASERAWVGLDANGLDVNGLIGHCLICVNYYICHTVFTYVSKGNGTECSIKEITMKKNTLAQGIIRRGLETNGLVRHWQVCVSYYLCGTVFIYVAKRNSDIGSQRERTIKNSAPSVYPFTYVVPYYLRGTELSVHLKR